MGLLGALRVFALLRGLQDLSWGGVRHQKLLRQPENERSEFRRSQNNIAKLVFRLPIKR